MIDEKYLLKKQKEVVEKLINLYEQDIIDVDKINELSDEYYHLETLINKIRIKKNDMIIV